MDFIVSKVFRVRLWIWVKFWKFQSRDYFSIDAQFFAYWIHGVKKKKKYEELEEKNSTERDTRGGYKTVYDQSCLGWRKVFRGSALAQDKYTLKSFKSALNVNTAGMGDTGTLSPGNRPILVPWRTAAQATVKLKSVKANGRYTINVSSPPSLFGH